MWLTVNQRAAGDDLHAAISHSTRLLIDRKQRESSETHDVQHPAPERGSAPPELSSLIFFLLVLFSSSSLEHESVCVCVCVCVYMWLWLFRIRVCGFQATYKALVIALAKLQNKNGRTQVCFHNSTSRAYFLYAHNQTVNVYEALATFQCIKWWCLFITFVNTTEA